MNNIVVEGNIISLRADGGVSNMADWMPRLAEQMASNEGLTLTEQHWDVLNTMREYYEKYNTSPILKLLRRELAKKFGADRASETALNTLFPQGVQYQATRLAGIPMAYLDAELDQASHVHLVQSGANSERKFNDNFEFEGKPIKVYASGNLVNLEDWSEALADALAKRESIQLTEEHWKILKFLRKFYFQYGVTPMVKVLIKHMTEELGADSANQSHMYKLFPGGPAKQGSRIAGLPSPQGCIDD